MRALRYVGKGVVDLVDEPNPSPGPTDALIRIEASAICGSERGALDSGLSGNAGHEACGLVIDPGPSSFAPGDRVGLSAVIGCGRCDRCQSGVELHCRLGFAYTSRSGWHAEMAAIDARALRALPDDIGPITGVLMSGDALGVPVRGLRRTPGTPGADVLIIGLGPVGLGHAIVRRFAGANVSGVEPSAYRRELGLRVGAQRVFGTFAEVEDRPSVVIECTGRPDCIARAFELVDDLGVVLQSGECGKSVPIVPSEHLIRRELAWTGAWYYATEDYPEMANLVSRGLRIADICTHEVTPELAQQAFSEFLDGRTGKVVIRWT